MRVKTEYGLLVNRRLAEIGRTERWLIEQVKEKTGHYCDYGLLYKIFTGKIKGKRQVAAINEILEIEDDYRADDCKQRIIA